jgi:predicted MPP superfamily phosphohydrolase
LANVANPRIALLALITAALGITTVWGFLVEPQALRIRSVSVQTPKWNGQRTLRIGVISDLHVGGPHVPPSRVSAIVERMNAAAPDIVVLLGDFVDDDLPAERRTPQSRATILHGINMLRDVHAPSGVFAVLGNHDVLYSASDVRSALQSARITLLENSAAKIPSLNVYLIGLSEHSHLGADYRKATSAVPAIASQIVLMHWPDSFPSVGAKPALSLAGHTHCGQIDLAVISGALLTSRASNKYRCGRYDENGNTLYVSGGVGTSILPVRLFAPPELSIVTLRSSDGDAGPAAKR